jgi:hypothetical protein
MQIIKMQNNYACFRNNETKQTKTNIICRAHLATPQQADKTVLNIKKHPGIPHTYFLMIDFIMFSQPKIQFHIESKTPNTNSNPLQCQLKFWFKILYIKCYGFHKKRMFYNKKKVNLETIFPFTLLSM